MHKKSYKVIFTIVIFLITAGFGINWVLAQGDTVSFEISHHHVAISVANAEESAAWYSKMFGFKNVLKMNQDGMDIIHIQRADCYIELFQVKDSKPLPDYRRDPTKDLGVQGTVHFAFKVDDVKAVIKEIQAKGAEVAMEPRETPGMVFAFIRDNSGNCFELIQFNN